VDPPRRRDADGWDRLARRERAERTEVAASILAEAGAIRSSSLFRQTGVGSESAVGTGAVEANGWLMLPAWVESLAGRIRGELANFHGAHPLAPGMEIAEIRGAVGTLLGHRDDPGFRDAVIERLLATGQIAREGTIIRMPEHRPSTAGRDEADRLVAAVASAEPTPPSVRELIQSGFGRELIQAACADGRLVQISPEIVITPALFHRAEAIVRSPEWAAGITVSTFRETLGTSRKYALPILESFDKRGITRRQGDVRIPRG
jgi:selenocysteine-specific elongation factor